MMKHFRMLAVIASLLLFAAACNGDATTTDEPADDAGVTDTDDGMTDDGMDDDGMMDDGDETTMVDVGCQLDLPEDGPGSADGMAQDPAGTAASNNPELSTLVEAVQAAGLLDTLNDPEATYTIFAPSNDAFAEIPEEDLNALLADQEMLQTVLTVHVVGDGERSLQELVDEGSVDSLQGTEVSIDAQDEQTVLIGDQQAQVICADVETANATVHIIDTVLMPADDGMGGGDMGDDMEATEEPTE